jgi:UDP-N-acetylglucosamine transferase subunit ALG13
VEKTYNVVVHHFQPELAHVIPMKLVVVVVVGRGCTMLAAVTKTNSFTSGQFTSSQTRVLQKKFVETKAQ